MGTGQFTIGPGVGLTGTNQSAPNLDITLKITAKDLKQYIRYYTSRYAVHLDSRSVLFGHLQRVGMDNFEITALIKKISESRVKTFSRNFITFVIFQIRKGLDSKIINSFLPLSWALGMLTLLFMAGGYVLGIDYMEKGVGFQHANHTWNALINFGMGLGTIVLGIAGLFLFLAALFGTCWCFNKAWDKIKEIA